MCIFVAEKLIVYIFSFSEPYILIQCLPLWMEFTNQAERLANELKECSYLFPYHPYSSIGMIWFTCLVFKFNSLCFYEKHFTYFSTSSVLNENYLKLPHGFLSHPWIIQVLIFQLLRFLLEQLINFQLTFNLVIRVYSNSWILFQSSCKPFWILPWKECEPPAIILYIRHSESYENGCCYDYIGHVKDFLMSCYQLLIKFIQFSTMLGIYFYFVINSRT